MTSPSQHHEMHDTAGFGSLNDPRAFDSVRTNRIFAFVIDAILIGALTLMATVLVFFLGIFTLGLGWLLFPILWPAVALIYVALTLGGPTGATPGMRAMGVTMRMVNGGRPDILIAGMHALLFWFSVSLLTPLVLAVSLFNSEKRLLHDLVLGTVVVRRASTLS
jgi:uncharacterized RDD family membrane protein YckC